METRTMKKMLLPLALLLSCTVHAQFGGTLGYNFNSHGSGSGEYALDYLNFGSYEAQLHYWFRLPNNRIEFQPTIYYGYAAEAPYERTNYSEYGAQLEVNVYPFDFFGDCGCPTFGKQGPHLEKGFFVQGVVGYAQRELTNIEVELNMLADRMNTTMVWGGGVGLDIGITNLLTITPLALIRIGRSGLDELPTAGLPASLPELIPVKQTSYQLGLQATFRLDSKNY